MANIRDFAENLSEKSLRMKLGMLILIIAVISGAYWYFFWSPQAEELRKAEIKLQENKRKLQEYENIADELPKFEKEFNKLTKEFDTAAKKLPQSEEIPALIDSVYAGVSASGLEPIIFAPKGQVNKEIYAEIPIEMEIIGSYFELANFFDRISRLPRIVNIRDLNLGREKVKGDSALLDAKFTTVTFKLLPMNITEPEKNGKMKKGEN